MSIDLILKGLILGFSIAAPVGPIGMLCIRRTLADGRAHGFVSGLGAATADAFCGAVAAFGLTLISDWLTAQAFWLRLAGGVFLIGLGLRTFFSPPAGSAPNQTSAGPVGLLGHSAARLGGAYLSTLTLTVTNPATILSFAIIFAGVIGPGARSAAAAGSLVLGVFAGSALWWLTLSLGVGLLRARFDARLMGWVNRILGGIIAAFGLAVLASLAGR